MPRDCLRSATLSSRHLISLLFKAEFEKALTRARAVDQTLHVIFVDLDEFKVVNDTIGHNAGDTVLRVMADRLRESLRDVELITRFGGDEFVVLLDPKGDPTLRGRTASGAATWPSSGCRRHPSPGSLIVLHGHFRGHRLGTCTDAWGRYPGKLQQNQGDPYLRFFSPRNLALIGLPCYSSRH